MAASKENPSYTAYVITQSGQKLDLSNITESISFSDQKGQISKSATIEAANLLLDGKWLSSIIQVRDRVFVYADDGEQKAEVFRGFVWVRSYRSSTSGYILQLKCYDQLIYWQESEDRLFFKSGKSTKDVISSICSDWGISLEYNYESITHGKLALRGTLSNIITDDLLDLVKDRTGKQYVILSEEDVVKIKAYGSNSTIYEVRHKQNGLQTTSEQTMDGMTTKVVIVGKKDKDDREPVEATVSGDTGKYGTLQKVISRDENTTLADAKKEAQSILSASGKPKWEYTVKAVDIPWLRKGDKVKIAAGDITETLIAVGIERDISNSEVTMTLTMEKP